jgi:N-carbamoyl-L-amino-acid hydrolase
MKSSRSLDRLTGLSELAGTGADRRRGGWSRHLWQNADLEMRAWFIERAERIGLEVEHDRNGNIWAWWGQAGDDAVVTGSHLDSVPGGGEFDGPLGVISALEAVERLRIDGFEPRRPLAVVVFAEEEGSRFGVACLGSQLMTGALDPGRVLSLRDSDGVSFHDAAAKIGFDVTHLGRDTEALERIGLFIELHVEQGRGLIDLGSPVAIASSILAHGRWTLSFRGQGNHAGATLMSDRDDPMVTAARAVLEVREAALASPGSRATVGRISAVPGGTNVIASEVTMTLDARAETDDQTRALVDDIARRVGATSFQEESWTPTVTFDENAAALLRGVLGDIPVLPSGAGHDAGILSGSVPTAMIFVRNPTGVSHAPDEVAESDDCLAGVDALTSVLRSVLQ